MRFPVQKTKKLQLCSEAARPLLRPDTTRNIPHYQEMIGILSWFRVFTDDKNLITLTDSHKEALSFVLMKKEQAACH
jgi:hypothetical protein